MPPFQLVSPRLFIPWRAVSSVEVTLVRNGFPAATIHRRGRRHVIRFHADIGHLVVETCARVGQPGD